MTRTTININDTVEVTLTEEGAAHLNATRAAFYAQYPHLSVSPQVTPGQPYSAQLWDIMRDFGPVMGAGMPEPFKRCEIVMESSPDAPRLSSGTLCVIGLAMACYNEHMGSKPAGVVKAEAELEELRKAQVDGAPVRSEVRIVDKDNPETWPPETGSLIACWRKAGLRPVIITALDAYCRERLTDGTFIAWMPVPALPGA